MEIIDTHCHLDMADFDADRERVLRGARDAGVAAIVVPGVRRSTWRRLLDICGGSAGLYPALGLHPMYIDHHVEADLPALEDALARRPELVAVGEIGLDFFAPGLDRERQQRLFEAQLVIARQAALPVLLHVRKAHDQVLKLLRKVRVPGGIAHAFNGSLTQAEQYLDLGFKLGFGGMLTFSRSRKLRTLAVALPLEALVLETDAPDMTVVQHRGERNSPEYLPFCLDALAEVRQLNKDLVAGQTTRNARAVLPGLTAVGDQ